MISHWRYLFFNSLLQIRQVAMYSTVVLLIVYTL